MFRIAVDQLFKVIIMARISSSHTPLKKSTPSAKPTPSTHGLLVRKSLSMAAPTFSSDHLQRLGEHTQCQNCPNVAPYGSCCTPCQIIHHYVDNKVRHFPRLDLNARPHNRAGQSALFSFPILRASGRNNPNLSFRMEKQG